MSKASKPGAAGGGARDGLPILSFTTLFPNDRQPGHGIFVEHRLRRLREAGLAEPRVVAPVPWFPLRHPRFGRYVDYASACREETRFGMRVSHPRYLTIPRVGMHVAPALLALAVVRHVRRAAREHGARLLDAHFLYPDGVAAAWLAPRLGLPLVLSARGTDANLLPEYALPRRMILAATARAGAVVCVSDALRRRLESIGVAPGKLHVLRNGVDLDAFHPMPRDEARLATGMRGRSLLCVGNLVELKGHHLVIEALARLPADVHLTLVGTGPREARLRELASGLGLAQRVHFAGRRPQSQLPAFYNAADALVLASSREGMPNVVLEALACGTPVVATRVGGVPEVVRGRDAGVLAGERSADALARALARLLADPPAREATRRHAEQFGWEQTTLGQHALFSQVIEEHRHGRLAEAAI